ncbi:MAG: alpha-N-acetylglucosaminidase [Lachnospiraceae bacterium]|nr:alpha-N-acetylglucosaminidase [Lachnospiraceae bacterium]
MQVIIDLTERFLPGRSNQFVYELIDSKDGKDTFELDSADGKIVLRGNNKCSIAAALGWYLKYTLKYHISWCGKRIPDVTGELPLPEPYSRVIEQTYRTYMNYCTHSYSAAWWDWERWEYEIDIMALNGINMPLAITGTESVWYHTLLDLGFTDIEAREFLAGPGFLAWQWMTNLEGHGGPLPMSWIEEHEALGRKILERELAFDMHPIQQGYSGFVPNLMKEKYPDGNFLIKKTWNNINHTTEIDPTDPLFQTIGMTFMKNQKKIFGTYGFYACDPFHEGFPPVEGSEYLNRVGKTISDLYEAYDKDYTWVMQAWSIRKDIATAVPKEHLLILDLHPDFPIRHDGYWGYPYVAGVLHNFGARMSLHGDLPLMAENRFNKAKESAPSAVGTGLFMEGIGQNPVFYDLALEMLTRSDSVDLDDWIKGYLERRYGKVDTNACKAWKLLLDHVYVRDTDFVERGTVLCTRPCLKLRGTGPMDSFHVHYDNKVLAEAIELLRSVDCDTEGYQYDLADLCRQMLSNYAQTLYANVPEAFYKKDLAAFDRFTKEFIDLLHEIDTMLAIRPEWTLQKWIGDARALGKTEQEKDQYEYNARMQITIWGNESNSLLFDYAWKEWSGLIGTYHAVRWQKFFDMLRDKLVNHEEYDEDSLPVFENRIIWHASKFYEELGDWEAAWNHDTTPIPLPKIDHSYVMELVDKYSAKITA